MNLAQAYKLLALVNLLVTAWRCVSRWTGAGEKPPAGASLVVLPNATDPKLTASASYHTPEPPQYSYRGNDYPLELPLDASDVPVAMTLHETVHFALNASSDPLARSEWDNLVTAPKEAGRVRLGPDRRLFTMLFWHRFHCLWSIQRALDDRNDSFGGYGHLHHCFNYVRQTLLCDAADTLELGDFMRRDFETDRVGDTVVCRDWQAVYTAMDENFRDWTAWAKEWD